MQLFHFYLCFPSFENRCQFLIRKRISNTRSYFWFAVKTYPIIGCELLFSWILLLAALDRVVVLGEAHPILKYYCLYFPIAFIILSWSALTSVVMYKIWFSSRGIVILFIFSYSAKTYFPFPILFASWLRVFHAFTAISSDRLLSSGVSRLVTPSLCSENNIFPSWSHTVTILVFGSRFNNLE